jgi:hypothetical protein
VTYLGSSEWDVWTSAATIYFSGALGRLSMLAKRR